MAFLVPKPLLGNALAGEVPRLPVTGDGPKPGLRAQMRSQAGAWERGKSRFEEKAVLRIKSAKMNFSLTQLVFYVKKTSFSKIKRSM